MMRNRRLVFVLGGLGVVIAAFGYYYLTSNAGLERPLLHDTMREEPAAPPPPAASPAEGASAIQKAGCKQSLKDLGLYRTGNVPPEIRPRDILDAEVRYCVESGILTREETAGLVPD
jgi:hypothetical protein